jgi:nitrogen regulatory protein P-II 1
VRLELFCADAVCDHLVEVIRKAAHTGNAGDGVIAVTDLDRVARIRTGQEQDEAV